MSSDYVVCWIFLQTFQTYFCIQANSVDPDQTAPRRAVWSGSTLFAKCLKTQADDKADVVTGSLGVKLGAYTASYISVYEDTQWNKVSVFRSYSSCMCSLFLQATFLSDSF